MTTFIPTVGQLERKTQDRIVALLRDRMGYDYLGNWEEREGNSNVEEEQLRMFLVRSEKSPAVILNGIADVHRFSSRMLSNSMSTGIDIIAKSKGRRYLS